MNTDYIIHANDSLLDALKNINNKGGKDALTLFVVNEDNVLIGTLTDGDIRRGLIKGLTLDSPVVDAAHLKFKYLHQGNIGVT